MPYNEDFSFLAQYNNDVFVKSRHSRLSGIFPCDNALKKKDSGQAGMTGKWCFSTFYETINNQEATACAVTS